MWHILILIGILVCAVQAVRTKRLLVSALWLAGTSAFVSIMMYLLGAYQLAVIELSVGAGLVTVLFVFAINIAGEEPVPALTIIPRPLAWILVLIAGGLIAWQLIPGYQISLSAAQDAGFQQVIWLERKLDLYLQIVFIFAGVISMLGLLSGEKTRSKVQPSEETV